MKFLEKRLKISKEHVMCVEYFTPSKEDIQSGLSWMNWYKIWSAFLNDHTDNIFGHDEMTVIDFTDCFTPEERRAHKNWFLLAPTIPKFKFMPSGNHYPENKEITVEFTSMMDFGASSHAQDLARKIIARGSPKDFTPVPVQSVLPDAQVKPDKIIKVSYRNTGIKTIEGMRPEDYFKKDKS
jgi:hypothetical protein